jgi:ferredoxin-NADP reductase
MARQLSTARLTRKLCLSESAQCFHLEFAIEGMEDFAFKAGQFVSLVREDDRGKLQTRAYSIASAPRGNLFDLCVNRVEGGFFSNLLADMKPGDEVSFHGPHGLFTLREPLTDIVLVATGTGIAPMRGFIQHLFPDDRPALVGDRRVWLVYGTRYPSELYYSEFFERKASRHPEFEYITTLSRPGPEWTGRSGYVQEHVARIAEAHQAEVHSHDPAGGFRILSYICGLNDMVSATRDRLTGLGWDKKQVIFERYD